MLIAALVTFLNLLTWMGLYMSDKVSHIACAIMIVLNLITFVYLYK